MKMQGNACHEPGHVLNPLKASLLALTLASGLSATAQTTTTSTNFTVGVGVPDDDPSGVASAKIISTPIAYITKVRVNAKLSGTFNGDIYCYLAHGGTNSILLNRVGRDATHTLGYSDKGFDLVFDDASTNGDVHVYRTKTGILSGPLTNSWVADGRRSNPTNVVTGDVRTNGLLNVFNGMNPNGEWVLFVADLAAGDLYTVDNWGLEITGYTPPSIVSAPAGATAECSSGSPTFSVSAAGSSPLAYQWRFNASPISGATGSSLTLNNVTFANAGSYDVVITNSYGSITSPAATLTVQDTTAPVPDLASLLPVVAQCSASLPSAPTATDACDGPIIGTPDQLGPFGQGDTTITWTFTDSHGNHSSQTQAVHVHDTQNPTITAPAALADVHTDAGKCYATGVALGTPITGDNCGVANVSNDAPAQFPKGTTTVTWTVMDTSGNTETATQLVTVKDHEIPTITAPAALADVHTDAGQCYASNVSLGSPTTGDNCGVASVVNDAPAHFNKGTTTVTWTVTDSSGNTATATQLVTVSDHENPTITCPGNMVVSTDLGQCTAVVTYSVSSSDNCPGQSVTQTAGLASGSAFPKGITTNSFTVTDASGNTASCSFTVTVQDHENPTITCPGNMVVNTDAGQCTAVVTYSVSSSDNCPGQSVTQTAGLASGSAFPKGITTNSFTVTDASGNTASCSFTVTVQDHENPTITCPADISLFTTNESGTAVQFTVTGTDNCSGVTIVSVPAPGSVFPIGTTIVTNTATDASGNTSQCTFTVTVLANQAPSAEDITMGAVENQSRSLLLDKVVAHCFDPDGDDLFVSLPSATSTNGGTVTLSATAITYTPKANFVGEDRFTYTVDDGKGGVASATIIVEVFPADALTPNITGTYMSGGVFHVRFAGIPGFAYHIERTQTMSPANWTDLGTVVAPDDGQVDFGDTNPPQGSAFYRTAAPLQ
jgi:subtilisin-like proprotein convertase family protein